MSGMSKIQKWTSIDKITVPPNMVIYENAVRAWNIINIRHDKILVSISGGRDSTVMMDIVYKADIDNKCDYVWFDTGLEYDATKRHLDYLQDYYNVQIRRVRTDKPVPLVVHNFGQPFLSKQVSEFIERMQDKDFDFTVKEDYDTLLIRYQNLQSSLKWFFNKAGYKSRTIAYNKWLRDFLQSEPPWFRVSNKCCLYAKKKVAEKLLKGAGYDLQIMGIRKAEGGVRSVKESCYDSKPGASKYYPLFWYTKDDISAYEQFFNLKQSDCYTIYGFRRTGCAGCPFGARHMFNELDTIKQFEPKLYAAISNLFKDSIEYTRMYYDFYAKMEGKS